MKKDERLVRLAEMAEMMLDARSAGLRRANDARDRVQAQIDALDAARLKSAPTTAAEARVAFAYDHWASSRKAQLNLELAQCQAECLRKIGDASLAFGRKQVIARLSRQTD